MNVKIISNHHELLLLQPAWEKLWSSIESPYYRQSFTYAMVCWKEISKRKDARLRCIVIREAGELVLVWPLIITKVALLKMLLPLGAGAAEYTEPLVKGGAEAIELCSLAWSSARSLKADIINLTHVMVGSPLHSVLSKEKPFSLISDAGYVLKGAGAWTDWDSFFKTVSAGHNLWSQRRRARGLAEQGTVESQMLENSSESAAIIDWCLDQKRKWAERTNKRGAWLYSDEFKNILLSLFTGESASQNYAIFLLTLDGSPIAAKMVAYNAVKQELIFTAFDDSLQKYSPGTMLEQFMVRWGFERSLALDFGVGKERYKKFWSYNNEIPVESYRFAGSMLGRLALSVREWQQTLRQRSGSLKDRTAVQDALPANAETTRIRE